jgi:signal transduction histidine kinase
MPDTAQRSASHPHDQEQEKVRLAAEQRRRALAERALDRLSRLQRVTAGLSGALTPRQVAEVVVSHGIHALDAQAGRISILRPDRRSVEVIGYSGYTRVQAEFRVEEALPTAEVLRTGQPLFVATNAEALARFPRDREVVEPVIEGALASAPLVVEGQVVGAMTLAFSGDREFEPDDRDLLLALARQCAQALERALLYERSLSIQEDLRRSRDQLAVLNVALSKTIQERDKALSDLQLALRTRDEFLASASHDLKNPLASIKATVQLLQRRIGRPEGSDLNRIRDGLQRLDATATRAVGLVEELVDLARLQMGSPLDLDRQLTDLVRLTREVVSEHQQATDRHSLSLDAPDGELVGLWDARRLGRVVSNLLDNATKYSPEGGPIQVRLRREGDWAVIEVSDAGIGIPSDEQERIFERFQRATNVATRISGTGIGLASARHILDSHGGSIAVDSHEGAGSTFIVRLPIALE